MTMPAASTRALLEGIVDYAGTYPPAHLPLDEVVATYARARAGSWAWLLGRLVVPAARLAELDDLLTPLADDEHGVPLPISAVLGADAAAQLDGVRRFNDRPAPRALVAAVEFPPTPISEIHALAAEAGAIETFFEAPLDNELPARLDAIAAARAFAKVRTGGVTAPAFPSAVSLAQFLIDCAGRGLGFKATAGLHHALRSCYALTYEPASATAVMHGFLNVAVAAVLARGGAARAVVAGVLDETSPEAFAFGPDEIAWRNATVAIREIDAARGFFRSFGSCSIREPVDSLIRLELV
jgi:hypothetical protein